jgi:hypothetical protein
MSLDISVRRHAVRALGLLGVYDKHLMMENLELINKVNKKKMICSFS